MRRAAKVDNNQAEIVAALREVGASVYCTHAVGGGFADLVVAYHGLNYLLEVKQAKGKLTEPESKFKAEWRGQVDTVHSVDEALRAIGAID